MKTVPFTKEQIERLAKKTRTPFYIYDESGIRAQVRRFLEAFSWNKGFKQHFAVKALPNPAILVIMKGESCGTDCSSMLELILSEGVGIVGPEIMFSSNDTPAEEFAKARELGAIINLDDINHLDFLERHAGLPDMLSFRYTPAILTHGNEIIGNPRESKFGVTKEQLFVAYTGAKKKGIRRFGLHAMTVSNELDIDVHLRAVRELFSTAAEVQKKVGIAFEFINLGGGIGIPYELEQREFNLTEFSEAVRGEALDLFGTEVPAIHTECGRYMTGPFGYLVARVRHVKESYKRYVGLDASMANLMRPGMYGAYHHISIMGKEHEPSDQTYDVVGSLCENNDKFAIDRALPCVVPGDIVAIHDVGAHGHSMGFNYNGKLRSAEFLLRPDQTFEMIRRAETEDDLLATLQFSS